MSVQNMSADEGDLDLFCEQFCVNFIIRQWQHVAQLITRSRAHFILKLPQYSATEIVENNDVNL